MTNPKSTKNQPNFIPNHNGNETEVRITLRCPKWMADALDEERLSRPGRVSRNQRIVEILDEHLSSGQ